MFVKYIRRDGIVRVAEMSSHITSNQVAETLGIASDAWEEITSYEADKIRLERQIFAQLARLDLDSVRALRSIEMGTAEEYDRQKLVDIEEKAQELRKELAQLEA